MLIGCLASHKLASEIAVAGCETLGARHIGQRQAGARLSRNGAKQERG